MATHLVKIKNTYYFRQRIPADLQSFFSKLELKHTLYAHTKRMAKTLHAMYSAHYSKLFLLLRAFPMTQKISKEAIEVWLKQNPGKPWTPPEFETDWINKRIGYNPYTGDTIQLLLDYGFVPDANGHFDLCKPPQNETIHFRHVGAPTPQSNVEPHTPLVTAKPLSNLTLQKAIELFLIFKQTPSNSQTPLAIGSISTYSSSLNTFLDFTENCGIQEAADKAPAFLEYEYKQSGLVAKTRKNKRIAISELFKWAFNNGYISTPVTLTKIATPDVEKVNKGNKPYMLEQLRDLINCLCTPQTRKRTPTKHKHRNLMSTLFIASAMLTGARKEELLQLKAEDISTINDHLCFNFYEVNTKNIQSRRAVPVHSALIKLGLLAYRDKLKPSSLLFPMNHEDFRQDLKAAQQAAGISQQKNQYTFHSFRHSLYTRLTDVETPKEVRACIVGHAREGMADTYDHYTEERLPSMAKYLEKTYTSIDFSNLAATIKILLNNFSEPATTQTGLI